MEPDREVGTPPVTASAAQLAAQERAAARHLDLGAHRWALGAVLAVYLIALVTPQVTGVAGWKVLTLTDAASEAHVKLTEYVLAWLAFLGIGVFTTATLVARRTVFAQIAWMLCTVGTFASVLALWLRQTRPGAEADIAAGVGEYLLILAVIAGLVIYCRIALRRSPEQDQIAQQRAQSTDLDDVAYVQNAALVRQQRSVGDDNPLLEDHRREQAARRHQRLTRPAESGAEAEEQAPTAAKQQDS